MRLLIVDNNMDLACWGSPDLVRHARSANDVMIHVRRGPQSDLPKDPGRFDRIIVSGSRASCLDTSPWVIELDQFIRRAIDMGKPLLGVCYGHQALCRAVGGLEHVGKSLVPELGWTEIEVLEARGLFAGFPKRFHSFSSHYEEVRSLPSGLTRLAQSADCAIQACQLGNAPVFGVQFHPERNAEEAEKSLTRKRQQGEGKLLRHAGESRKYYNQELSERIFKNFFSL